MSLKIIWHSWDSIPSKQRVNGCLWVLEIKGICSYKKWILAVLPRGFTNQVKHSSMKLDFHTNTPFKKSNATRFWSIIFLLSWIFIHQVRYLWKSCLFAFRLMPNLLGLFYWARAGWVNWGQHQEGKVAKLIGLNGKCVLYHVFGFPFVSVRTRTHGPFIARNPPKVSEDSVQWMGRGYSCIHSQKESRKLDITCISHSIRPICNLSFLVLPSIYSPCTRPSKTILTNMVSIERQINRLSRDI